MKKLDYKDFDKCIICLENDASSFEHIIPQSIGGRLQVSMLCNECNNKYLGSNLVSQFQNDPSIRLAIRNLKETIPKIYEQYESGQYYFGKDVENNVVKMQLKNNKLKVKTTQNEDGTMIYDPEDAPKHINNIMHKTEMSKKEIDKKMKLLDKLKTKQKLKITSDFGVEKKAIKKIYPDLTGDIVSKKLLILIAYEYMALLVGNEIYNDFFDKVRKYILGDDIETDIEVDYLMSKDYRPHHKMYSVIKKDCIIIKIVLFGKLVYKITFDKITVKMSDFVYIENLKNKKSLLAKSLNDAKDGLFFEL
ncbi:HNH endonuclease [Halanaerobium congolense]|jgi:hypothetical protein|uniref:HNH endonuclease n=1 Tax=Halanaerobium congolense TaxID=54121 RepID=UPI00105D2C02|nr:HNH endonuclease [Halanaerobium congolense]TDP26844.1 HNH endonuclease [Halanaerobium congolense]